MPAPTGNNFWQLVEVPGRPPKYDTPLKLWNACVRYFRYVKENPIVLEKTGLYKGSAFTYEERKMRAMLLSELCAHIGVTQETWNQWRHTREDLSEVITRVEEIIWEQKFQGAVISEFNSNIIAQHLGLKSKLEHSVSGETFEGFLQGLEEDIPDE